MVTSIERPPRLITNSGARRGVAVEVRAGEALQVIDVQGRQTATLIAFNQHDLTETLSPAMTRGRLGSIMLQLNDRLYSITGRAMFVVEADTVGRHDLLLPAFDITYYEESYSSPGHDNCRANLFLAVQDRGIAYNHLPDPITLFGNVSIRQRGELEIRTPLSEPGDSITLRALVDVVVAVAASAQDRNQQNDYNPTEIFLRVLSREGDG